MSQFGSEDLESQFDTTQDIPFDSQYSLSPDTSAAMDAGSYNFEQAQPEPSPLEGLNLPAVRVGMPAFSEQDLSYLSQVQLPTTTRSLPGMPTQETMDALRPRTEELPFESSNVGINWEQSNRVVAPQFESIDQQEQYKSIDALWDQLSGAEDQRKQEDFQKFGQFQPVEQITPEQVSPQRSKEALQEGVLRSDQMQGVRDWRFLGVPVRTTDEGFDRVLENRNVRRALQTNNLNSPDVERYFNSQKFSEKPGFGSALVGALGRGTLDVALLPQSLLVDLPVSMYNRFVDESAGVATLENARQLAAWRAGMQENAGRSGSKVGQFVLDLAQGIPQVAAQTAAALLTGGNSLLAQGAARAAVFAAMGAGQTATNNFYDSLDAETKAGTPIELAAQRAMRDAMVGGAITGVTESLVGAFGKGWDLLKPTTMASARAALGDTTIKTFVRGAKNGLMKEGTQETLDQFLGDFAVNMFRQGEEEFKDFYAQNPDWMLGVIKNSLYAGLVGGALGVPTSIATAISDKNQYGRLIGGLDKIIGALPDNDPRIRMLQRDTATPEEALSVIKWLADQEAKLVKDTAQDIKQEKTLGAALDLDGIDDFQLMSIVVGGNNGDTTARLRGVSDQNVGKFANIDFVVTGNMAADELARRELVRNSNTEGARTAVGAQAGMVNPATATETKEFVTDVPGAPEDSMALIPFPQMVYEATGAKEDAVKDFVRQNPAIAARLAAMEQPISRKMMEQMAGRAFPDNSVDFRSDFKEQLKKQVEAQKDSPRRLQEGINNSRRNARTEILAALSGLTEDEVARVAMGVSPAKARVVSRIMSEAAMDANERAVLAPGEQGPAISPEMQMRRADTKEAADALTRRRAASQATLAPVLQQWESGEFVAKKFSRDSVRDLRAKYEEYKANLGVYEQAEMVDAVATEMIDAIRAVIESGDDSAVALKDFGEARAMFDYIAGLNPKMAAAIRQRITDEFGSTDPQRDVLEKYRNFVADGGIADAAIVEQAATQRAEARVADLVDSARRNAIYALDRDEARAKNDPAYIVSRSDAIDILTTDMDDQTRRDIATIIDSGNSLGLELKSVLEDQFNYNIDELPEPTPGANVNEAIGRITGRLDLIRRTGEGVEKVVRKAPGFKETNAGKIDAMLADNATMQSDLEALKQERAKIERALQPFYEAAWLTKPKGKQPAKKRKKRLPATEEEIKLDRQLKDIDGQIEQLIGRINANAESLGAEKIAVPNPVKAEETATFRDTNPQKRADEIAATRLRIAQLNGIDANDIELRYDDGETTLSAQEKALSKFGNKLGITVVIMKTPEGSMTSGAYNKGVVYIDYRDAGRPSAWLSIALHETMHHLADTDKTFFAKLYRDLNRKIPKAMKAVRAAYSQKLDAQARMASVRRAGLVLFNDESEKYTDALLWLIRNDQSPELSALRQNLPDQIANALDAQNLDELTEPGREVIDETKKRLKQEINKADRYAVTDELLQEEEVANLAEMLMDTTFVSIVDEKGELDFAEVKRLAKTAKSTNLLSRLASGITDAFYAIPLVTQKMRGLNPEQAARLRNFADNPSELNNPRSRQAAQALIAKAIMHMMKGKRGEISLGGTAAQPMSASAAAERIPALRQSVRTAMNPATEADQPDPTNRENFDSLLRQAIRSVASFNRPMKLPAAKASPMSVAGVTPIVLLETSDGNQWVFKHTDKPGMMNNEIFANIMAEQLGSPAFMPQWARATYEDPIFNKTQNIKGSAAPFKPGITLFSWLNEATFETRARAMPAISILAVGDLHHKNLNQFGQPIDYGDAVLMTAMGSRRRDIIDELADPDASMPSYFNFLSDVKAGMYGAMRDTAGDFLHPETIFRVGGQLIFKKSTMSGVDFVESTPYWMVGIPHKLSVQLLKQYADRRLRAQSEEDIRQARIDFAYDFMQAAIVGSAGRTLGDYNYRFATGDRPFMKSQQPTEAGLRTLAADLAKIAGNFVATSEDIDEALIASGVGKEIKDKSRRTMLHDAVKDSLVDRAIGFRNSMESILDLLNPNLDNALIDDDDIVRAYLKADITSMGEFGLSDNDRVEIDRKARAMFYPPRPVSSTKPLAAPSEEQFIGDDPAAEKVRQSIRHRNVRSTVDIMNAATDEEARRLAGANSDKPARGNVYNKVRDIGLALSRRTLRANLEVSPGDVSPKIVNELADIVADEVQWNLGVDADTGTGVGWYSKNWPDAVKKLGVVFPELRSSREARDVFSALVAIMSNGAKVRENMKSAIDAYAMYRSGTKLSAIRVTGRRSNDMISKLKVLEGLIDIYGMSNFRRHMLTKTTVADMNARLRAEGKKTNNDYLASTIVPRSSAYFGPKLGMFFANLMGGKDYLTMDMWWTRSINRMRGLLEAQPTDSAIERFREALGPDAPTSRYDLFNLAEEIREPYADRNYMSELEQIMGRKEGRTNKERERFHAKALEKFGARKYNRLFERHTLEKNANNIAKAAFDQLNEAPFNATDRKFMMDIAKSAQSKLSKRGIDLSISDIQAALWYYEKRLYDRIRGGGKEDIGYDEAAIEWVEANRGRPQRPGIRFSVGGAGRPVGRGTSGTAAQVVRDGSAERPAAGRRPTIRQSLRDSESNYQPANLAAAENSMMQALASDGGIERGGPLERLGKAWLGTARQIASRYVPMSVDVDDIEIVNKPADINPFFKWVAAPLNLAIGSGNQDVVSVVEDMINMDMERNMLTESRKQEAEAVWNSIPEAERNEAEFAKHMDMYHDPAEIDADPAFAGKSQAWRDALKWFKNREEIRRNEIIDVKREAILGMLKRDNSARLVKRAAENGKTWTVTRNAAGKKVIDTGDTGIVSIPEARDMLSKIMMPDNWGRQYAHFYHWFGGEYKLAGYNDDGTREIIGTANTEPEAYERLYAYKRANPGKFVKYTAEPAVQINPDEVVRMSDAQRRRLERMLADATGAYRDEVADAMRGIVGSKTSKRPFYAPLMERTGAKGFETDFMKVWNMSERLHNRWSMGGRMVRELTPRIEGIRRKTPGWGDYLAESMRHTLYTAPTATEAALDATIRAIPVVGKMVGPFATRRLLGSLRALNYGRQLLTVRQNIVNSFQPLQTVYPILGEKGLMEAIAFYNSDEGKEVLKKYGGFDGAGRFREGDESALEANIQEFVATMNDKIYKKTNETFNPRAEARNQNFAFVAMYWHGKQKGMTDAEAARYGRVYGNVYTQFYYTKANIPWLLRGPVASTSLQYRRFAINTTGLLVNEFQKGNYSGVARYMAVMSMLGGIQASIGLSLVSLIRSAAYDDKEGADDLSYKLRKWLKGELGSEKAADIAMMGLPAAIGIDLSGSISIWQKPFGRNLYEKIGATVSGPTINTALQMMTNLTAETAVPMSVGERAGRAVLDSSPTAQQIISLWKLMSDDNVEYDARGRMKYKLDPMDAFLKSGAFRTVSESVWSMEYQRLRIIRNEVDRYADKAATYLAGGNVAEAQRSLQEFNSLYPMASMTFRDIETRVKNKKLSREIPQLQRRVDVETGVKARAIANQEEIGQ